MTQRTLPTANHRGIRASSEDRSAALLRASLEKRNAKLADTVGRQAKMIERLRQALNIAAIGLEAHGMKDTAAAARQILDETKP